jgi:hypothetical protein
MGGDLDLVADLRGLLERDVPLAFGFALPVRKTRYDLPSLPVKDLRSRPRPLLFGSSATVHSPTCCDAQRKGVERPAPAPSHGWARASISMSSAVPQSGQNRTFGEIENGPPDEPMIRPIGPRQRGSARGRTNTRLPLQRTKRQEW